MIEWRLYRVAFLPAVVAAIVGWGACVIGFGVTSNLWLALAFLAGAGMADMISAVFRTAIMQTAAPDEMRARCAPVSGSMRSMKKRPVLSLASILSAAPLPSAFLACAAFAILAHI